MAGFENSSIPNLNPLKPFQVNIFGICVSSFKILFGPPTHVYVLWLIVTGKGIPSELLNFNISVCEIIIGWIISSHFGK